MPWITPDNPPGDLVCYQIWLPAGVEYEGCAAGAFLSLAQPENWEQVDGQGVSTVAEAFLNAFCKSNWWRLTMPIGSIIWGGWSAPPEGYLLCDGSILNAGDYPELYTAIANNFGGSPPLFALPNLADRVGVGVSGTISLGNTGGAKTHTLTELEMPPHTHSLNATITPTDPVGPNPTYGYNAFPALQTNSKGGGSPHNNMQPYIGLTAVIKYK